MDKDKMTSNEIEKLMEIYSEIDEDRKPFAERLVKQLVFMSNTLNTLQDKVNSEGAVIESTNGNGFTTYNEHPAQKSYNTMIKNYNATIKALIELIPDKGNGDELMKFISGNE